MSHMRATCETCSMRRMDPKNEEYFEVVDSGKPPHAYKKICVGCGRWIAWVSKRDEITYAKALRPSVIEEKLRKRMMNAR